MKNVLIRIWHLLVWLAGFTIQIAMIFCLPVVGIISVIALFTAKVSCLILVFYVFILFFKGQWMFLTLETFKYGLAIAGIFLISSLPIGLLLVMDFGNYLKDTRYRWLQKQRHLEWVEAQMIQEEQNINSHGHHVHVIDGTLEEVTT